MHITKDQVIAGQPALHIRKLLRYGSTHWDELRLVDIQALLEVDQATAEGILQVLEAEGYLEENHEEPAPDEEQRSWRNTLKGNALTYASAKPPVKRSSAERALTAFLQRVEEVNTPASAFAYRVQRVVVFGSYLGDSPTLNDVDLCVWLVGRFAGDGRAQHEYNRERVKLAEQVGRTFSNYGVRLFWPWLEVWSFLKHRSPILAFHDGTAEQVLKTGIPSKVLYPQEVPATDVG